MKTAVILLSGGLDSTTCLAIAQQEGYSCHALSFDYGQRHLAELNAAKKIAQHFQVKKHHIIPLDPAAFNDSLLTHHSKPLPSFKKTDKIAATYVPARNTVFLSLALAYAETIQAEAIFIGVNAVDYSNYPDCRPLFIETFQKLIEVGTKSGVEGQPIRLYAPLLHLSKKETIQKGLALGVDYSMTVSCYAANEKGEACGKCDSCGFRQQGFQGNDPTRYTSAASSRA